MIIIWIWTTIFLKSFHYNAEQPTPDSVTAQIALEIIELLATRLPIKRGLRTNI